MTRIYVAPNRKLSMHDADIIRRAVANGVPQKALADTYQVSAVMISQIVTGKTYNSPDTPRQVAKRRRKELNDAARTAIATYRAEKAKRDERLKHDKALADAKKAYKAQLAREKEARKGGRPKASGRGGQKPMGHVGQGRPNQFVNVHEDPRDALLNALGAFQGAA